jgi:FkbM family methyltransferase
MTVCLRTSDDFASRLLADAKAGIDEYESRFGDLTGPCLDIGAHYGAWTLQALEAGATEVTAVEASAVNYAALIDNILASDRHWGYWGAIPLWAAALETDAATVPLRRAARGNSGQYSVGFHDGHPISDAAVPVLRFSTLFGLRPTWSYVKIDVEGGEWSFLNDPVAVNLLLTHAKFIDLETHPLDSFDYFPKTDTPFRYIDEVAEDFRKQNCTVGWSVQHPTRIYIESA